MSSPPLLEPGSGATARQGVRDSRRRWWLWAVIAAFVVVEAGVVVAHGAGVTGRLYIILVPVGAATMLGGWWLSATLPARWVLVPLVAGAVLLRVLLVPSTPALSNDLYRYLWDGRVQASGINPYEFPPDAAELRPLRDDEIWPRINRKSVRTIYPGGAQLVFRGAHILGLRTPTAWKALLASADLAGLAAIVLLLRRRGLSARHALLYAWNPLVVLATAQAGHLEALAVVPLVFAVLAWDRERPWMAGLLVGAAGALKLYPLLVVPALLRRRGGGWAWPTAPVAAAVTGLLYLPYVAAGTLVGGYLTSGYLREEGYRSGRRFALAHVVGLDGTVIVATLLVAVTAWVVWSRRDAAAKAALLWGTALLLTVPYGWYAIGLVALAVVARPDRFVGRLAWPTFSVGLYAVYLLFHHGYRPLSGTGLRAFLAAATLTALVVAVVSRRRRRMSADPPTAARSAVR